MPNRPDYCATWLGVTQIGGVVALLNTSLTGAALAHCVGVAAPRHVIVAAEFADAFGTPRPVSPIARTGCTAKRRRRRRGSICARGLDGAALCARTARDAPADRALMIYTSGTTGLPKAANVSHYRIMSGPWFAGLAGMSADDRMYDCLPMHHSVGGVVAIGAPLVRGGSVVFGTVFGAHFWDEVARWDCTVFQYIGELCRYLVAAPPHPPRKIASAAARLRQRNGRRGLARLPGSLRHPAHPRILRGDRRQFLALQCRGQGRRDRQDSGSFYARASPIAIVRFDFDAGAPMRGADGFCVRCAVDEAGEAIGRIRRGDPARVSRAMRTPPTTAAKVLRDVFAPGDA